MSDLRFLLDENVPCPLMRFLKSERYYVEYVPRGVKIAVAKQIASP